jgi:hypothetical protein
MAFVWCETGGSTNALPAKASRAEIGFEHGRISAENSVRTEIREITRRAFGTADGYRNAGTSSMNSAVA